MSLTFERGSLKEVTLDGQPLTGQEKVFLRELSAGAYTLLAEKLKGYSQAEEEEMTILRYQTMIVFLCLWENEETGERPFFVKIADEWLSLLPRKEHEDPRTIDYKHNQFTAAIRQVTPDEFIAIVDYFSDMQNRSWIQEVYQVTDEHLQPTDKATKEALKNE